METTLPKRSLPAKTASSEQRALATNTSNAATLSKAETRAMSKNRQRSGAVNFISFGGIERDGCTGPVKLVRHGEELGKLLQQRLKPDHKRQRCLVNLQPLMIELAVHP